jgi:hypothetical protein
MEYMFDRIYKPEIYHGRDNQRIFFEGWYFKLISADQAQRWAVIPGIFHHPDPDRAHAFIQVLDGMTSKVVYYRFAFEDFNSSSNEFEIRVGNNHFHSQGFSLDLRGEGQPIQGELKHGELQPWPIRLLSPGVMGPYRFAPFMQTYHGILSLDHEINGSLQISGEEIDFSGGRGYMEKDWGKTFPRAYIWMQSNHFQEEGVSLSASVATIPWLSGWFRGFLVGLLIKGNLYRFTTYLSSRINHLSVNDQFVTWSLQGTRRTDPEARYPKYQLDIEARRGQGGLLSSPELDGMTPRILESLTGELRVTLTGLDNHGNSMQIIYQGLGTNAGLEIAGTVNEIATAHNLEEQ